MNSFKIINVNYKSLNFYQLIKLFFKYDKVLYLKH